MKILADGKSPKNGLLIDFVGDFSFGKGGAT
jgi:hypothetical protein